MQNKFEKYFSKLSNRLLSYSKGLSLRQKSNLPVQILVALALSPSCLTKLRTSDENYEGLLFQPEQRSKWNDILIGHSNQKSF